MATVDLVDTDTLVIGLVSIRRTDTTYTQPAGWTPLPTGQVACAKTMVAGGAWIENGAPAQITYAPTLGKKSRWADVVVAYNSD